MQNAFHLRFLLCHVTISFRQRCFVSGGLNGQAQRTRSVSQPAQLAQEGPR